jgi:hypothetical protein
LEDEHELRVFVRAAIGNAGTAHGLFRPAKGARPVSPSLRNFVRRRIWSIAGLTGLSCFAMAFVGITLPAAPPRSDGGDAEHRHEDEHRLTVEAARDRSRLMHTIYAATLETMHRRYFHDDRATVPARAMHDVFAKIERSEHIQTRWISVNTRAMSLDHEPRDAFEKAAAKAIRSGEREFEAVQDGRYRHAGAIVLTSECLRCHGSMGTRTPSPRFAGLVISIPVREE